MADLASQNWAIFVSQHSQDAPTAFSRAMLLLEQMKPDDELPDVIESRLSALAEPLPACFDDSPFAPPLAKAVQDARLLLLAAKHVAAPVKPATMADMSVPSREVAKEQPPARAPTHQQLANALDAMAASRLPSYAAAVTFLSAPALLNTFSHITVSAEDSPVRFVIVEVREEGEIYVAFPGTDCWEDVVADVSIHSKATPTGRYHHGFFERASKLPVAGLVERVLDGAELFLVGHSLGGAVATVVTIEMLAKYASLPRDRVHCITAGAPLVGDPGILRRCEQLGITDSLYHMVEPGDAVPRLLSFVGAIKNYANLRNGRLKDAVQYLARQCCRLASVENPQIASAVEKAAGCTAATVADVFVQLTFNAFEPVGKFWHLPDDDLPMKVGKQPRWLSAMEYNLQVPSSYEEVVRLLRDCHHHELDRYRQTVMAVVSHRLTNRCNTPPVEAGVASWKAHVSRCNVSVSNGRLACDVTGERLSLVRRILVGRQRFNVTPASVVSSRKLAIEIDRDVAGEPFEAAVAKVTAGSMAEECSFTGDLMIIVSDMSLNGQGDVIASLDFPEVMERLFRMYLLRPPGSQPLPDPDPINIVESLCGCQPIETIHRFLAGRQPLGLPVTFNILGRLPDGVEAMVDLGISLGAIECLQEALRHRFRQMDMRKAATELGTLGRAAGAGVAVMQANSIAAQLAENSARLAAATSQLAAAQQKASSAAAALNAAKGAKAAADSNLAAVQQAARHDPGTVARWFHRSARKAHVAYKNAKTGMGTAVQHVSDASARLAASGQAATDAAAGVAAAAEQTQNLSAAQAALNASAQTASFTAKYGMFALTAGLTALEAYSLYRATQMTKEGSSYGDVYQELVEAGATAQGNNSWDVFDLDMVRGISAADVLASIVDRKREYFPSISAESVLAELFPRSRLVLDAKETLLKQRQELHDLRTRLRAAGENCSQQDSNKIHRDVERAYSKMADIHTYWTDFITAALSDRTDVALSRNVAASALWVTKQVLLDNVLQAWVPAAKALACGSATTSQEQVKKLREAISYVMDACSFEARVDVLLEGIVGAATEHLFDGKRLYSKLYAIRKHVPHGVTWRSRPIDISSKWETVMAEPGIVPNSRLARITKDSRFEVACWLVSCLCVAELYDCCMSGTSVAVMGVTSTGKSSLTHAISVNPDEVVAGGLSKHRTSIPLMHLCRPFAENQRPFSILDTAGLTDRENVVDDNPNEYSYLPGEAYLPMTRLCSALVTFLPHRLAYVEPFQKQLLWLFDEGRTVESGRVMNFITKCEDVIDEALKVPAAAATELIRGELEHEVRRIAAPGIMGMANTRYAVISNPRNYSSGDLQRLGIWQLEDIHKWMSDHCN